MFPNVEYALKELDKTGVSVYKNSLPGVVAFFSDVSGTEAFPYFSVVPKNIEELCETAKILISHKVPVTVRGAGTSTAAASLPENSVMISTLLLDKMKIYEDDFIAEVEPGVITGLLKKKVSEKGLFYPPDPASFEYSTIGGNILTNAGGPSSIRYGTTRDYLKAIEIIDGKGNELSFGKMVHKYSSGYFIPSLFSGSEGTLGILKKAYLKLVPLPPFKSYFKVENPAFDDFSFFRKLPVANLEYISAATASLVTGKAEGVLLLMVEEFTENALISAENIVVSFLKERKYLFDKSEVKDDIWEIRKRLSHISYQLGEKKISQDITIPLSKINSFVLLVERRSSEEKKIKVSVFGHLGDGNLHINIMTEKAFINEAMAFQKWLMGEVFKAGGVPSGEHGLGILRKNFLSSFFKKEEIETMKEIKKVFDPYNLMNPGKIF